MRSRREPPRPVPPTPPRGHTVSPAVEKLLGIKRPSAFLWSNGNAWFFDEQGEEIPDMQRHGWAGLHAFVAKWADAPVYMAEWGTGLRIGVSYLEGVLKHLRKPGRL